MSCRVLGPMATGLSPMAWEESAGAYVAPSVEPQTPPAAGVEERLREMELRCETAVRQAQEQGCRKGEQQGRERQKAELQPVMDRMAETIETIAGLREKLIRDTEADLLKLSLAIARRILNRELAVEPDAVGALIHVALQKMRGQQVVRVRVHPAQEAGVREFARRSPVLQSATIVVDAKLESGGAVLETARGNLDATVDSQLDEIERGLADRLKRRPA